MKRGNEESITRALNEIWPRVKKKHLFPQIPTPVVGENDEAVAIEMKDKQIILNQRVCEKLAEEMPREDVIEALLDHGTSHYTYCPWDLSTHLFLYSETKQVIKDPEMVKRVTGYFMDIVGNTYCVKEKGTKIPELYKYLERQSHTFQRTELDKVISSLYQRIWGVNLDVSGYNDLSGRLSRIPYLDKDRWSKSIKSFARIIRPLLESEKEKTAGDGNSQNTMGDHGLSGYSEEEIEDGLREFAGKTGNPEEFKEMVSDFEDELKDLGFGETGGMGRGHGESIDADLLFYMKLAEHFNIPIQKIPMEKSGSMHPHSHTPWEVGRPFQDIDIWTSFGKIIPGITQVWNKREGEIFGEMEGTPDCIIVIDSSGSMVNPTKNLSYAVLGAGCASDAYLRSDSRVAVYNFSDAAAGGKQLLDFSRNRKEVYGTLCRYFGGGTNLKLKDLEVLRRKSKTDIFIITDMQITNLEKVIDYFSEIDNRVTAVYIGRHNRYAKRFEEATQKRKNIALYNVDKKEDIPSIVLGKIKEYFRMAS
ncbi:MAG: vWA domain-containing protein [Thermodesulfobacteriota bacterium]|nr:vWA domain-containing protein [Thermodesulfobacteriota bacterium]